MAGLLTVAWPGPAGAATVRVNAGVTLSQIARDYGTSVPTLVALNRITDPNLVVAGTSIQVPPSAVVNSTMNGRTDSVHVVVAVGDSLWTIAERYGTTVGSLARTNGIADPSHVMIGSRLTVPASSSGGMMRTIESGGSAVGGQGRLPAALLAHPSRLAALPLFKKWAGAYGVPAPLLEAMCWWESGWQMSVVSSTGAMGIGQLEPSTVRTLRAALGKPTLNPNNLSDNIEMASAYLRQLLSQTGGNKSLALAGYYQGLASVRHRGMMPSAVQYVHGIIAFTPSFS